MTTTKLDALKIQLSKISDPVILVRHGVITHESIERLVAVVEGAREVEKCWTQAYTIPEMRDLRSALAYWLEEEP
jgi:hypothetical protein